MAPYLSQQAVRGSVYGIGIYGDYYFTAHLINDRWLYTHREIPGAIASVFSEKLEGIVNILLDTYPDIYEVRYLDANKRLQSSFPARAIPHHIAELVAKELEK